MKTECFVANTERRCRHNQGFEMTPTIIVVSAQDGEGHTAYTSRWH